MKSLITFILLTVVLCCNAQTKEEMISSIRQHFNYVEANINTFKQSRNTTFEESSEGAEITSFFDKGKLVKIRAEYLGETGKLYREFYIKNEQLLFVYDQEYSYNMPYYIDTEKAKEMGFDEGFNPDKTEKQEHRYYFFNNKLIRWIDPKGKLQTRKNTRWLEKENYYLDEFNELIR